jgi:hypothetical protein
MADWLLRLRALLDKQFAVVFATLILLSLVGGWMTYTVHATPNTTTEERPVSSWQTTGWFNHSATVTENNSVYPVGTTLTNRSIYFAEIAPWFNGTYTFTYDASERGDLDGMVTLQFVLQGVEENRDSTTVVWQTTNPLGTTSSDSLKPGETVRVPFSVNMNQTMNRTEIIDEQLDNSPGQPEVVIRATVDIQGTVNGQRVDRIKEHMLPVALEQGTYRPANPGRITDKHEATRTVTVQQPYGPLRNVGAPALLFGPLVALVGLVAAQRKDRLGLSPAEREVLAYEGEREDFDEWISTIQLPDEAFGLPRAEAASLGALVDFAIDTDNSVIEDPDDGTYYVVQHGYLYTYQPPTLGDEGIRILQTESDYDEPERTDGESTVTPTTDGESDSSEGMPPDG